MAPMSPTAAAIAAASAIAPEPSPTLSSWDEWSPRDYLADYYRYVEPDELKTIRFLVQAAATLPAPAPMLVFGCGPTLHHVFPLAPYASELHLTDYLPGNLDEIDAWLGQAERRHDWRPFVRYTLECEGVARPSDRELARRQAVVRSRVTKLLVADAGDRDPLGPASRAAYPVVVSCYCADSATADKGVWSAYMTNIVSMLAPGGTFITAALRRARHYRVGARHFPSANVDEHDLHEFLARELGERVMVETRFVPEHEELGYTGIILGRAVKRRVAVADKCRPVARTPVWRGHV